ncbi:hypothetical protein MC885_002799 [Smutsia gigantea]|nr:hypothetical protein MC885_002799 [Smutsia gigantea]
MDPSLTPARSPVSAGKFVRESTLGALQLRHRGGLQKRLPDPTLRDRTPYPSRAHHLPSGLGSSNLRDLVLADHAYRLVVSSDCPGHPGQEVQEP